MTQFFAAALGAPQKNQTANAFLDWAQMAKGAALPTQEWSIPEAFFAVLFSAASCDGELAREEQETVLALLHRSRALKALSLEELASLNAAVVERLRTDEDALGNACGSLPQDMRLPVFAQALDIVLADGELNKSEAAFLNRLVAELGLERADVERVADVMMLKNRY